MGFRGLGPIEAGFLLIFSRLRFGKELTSLIPMQECIGIFLCHQQNVLPMIDGSLLLGLKKK